MRETCRNDTCCYSDYCLKKGKHVHVTKDTKKSIANSVTNIVCKSDWKRFSVSSLLESDGRRLEDAVHQEQLSHGYQKCFKSPF